MASPQAQNRGRRRHHDAQALQLAMLFLDLGGRRLSEGGSCAPPEDAAARVTAAAMTRVALVSTDGKDVIRNVLDLAEAELGSEAKIELLERRQIERVLREQKLSLSGLVEANQIVAAGKLLSVDLFAVVETAAGGKEVLGLIVFQAQTGVRLWDAPCRPVMRSMWPKPWRPEFIRQWKNSGQLHGRSNRSACSACATRTCRASSTVFANRLVSCSSAGCWVLLRLLCSSANASITSTVRSLCPRRTPRKSCWRRCISWSWR